MIRLLFVMFMSLVMPSIASAFEEINTGYFNDTALQGYDSATYFTQSKAVVGEETLVVEWKGAKWQFADAKSRALFLADPEQYAPQFGGYCSNQMSLGNISDIDPGVWLIYDEKLYFFGHQAGKDRWERTGVIDRIEDANRHWQAYLKGK